MKQGLELIGPSDIGYPRNDPTNKECLCEWPDGTIRKVMVISVDDGKAKVIWNERDAFIEGNGCMVGLDDNVPLAWLYIPANR